MNKYAKKYSVLNVQRQKKIKDKKQKIKRYLGQEYDYFCLYVYIFSSFGKYAAVPKTNLLKKTRVNKQLVFLICVWAYHSVQSFAWIMHKKAHVFTDIHGPASNGFLPENACVQP